MMMENKENSRPAEFNSIKGSVAEAKGRSTFGKLLKSVTNEMRTEEDEKLAVNTQLDEAAAMAAEWMQEEKGKS